MGTYLSTPILEKEIDSGEEEFVEDGLSISYACVEMQGWRKSMEDAHIAKVSLTNPAGELARVFGAFDGHGGGEVARFCKEHFINVLLNRHEWSAGDVGQALKETYFQLDRMIDDPCSHDQLSLLKNQPQHQENTQKDASQILEKLMQKQKAEDNHNSSMTLTNSPTRMVNGRQVCNLSDHPIHAGCTAIVCVINHNTLTVANAGDSRAVLCRKDQVMPLSTDHKPLNDDEMLRIQQAGGFVNHFGRVNGNLNVSRSIGDLKYKQAAGIMPSKQMITALPDILQFDLMPDDEFIIIGCDGIWDCLSNQDCVDYVRQRIDHTSLTDIGTQLLDDIVSKDPRATQGIGGDNMTFLLVDLKSASRSLRANKSTDDNAMEDKPTHDQNVMPDDPIHDQNVMKDNPTHDDNVQSNNDLQDISP